MVHCIEVLTCAIAVMRSVVWRGRRKSEKGRSSTTPSRWQEHRTARCCYVTVSQHKSVDVSCRLARLQLSALFPEIQMAVSGDALEEEYYAAPQVAPRQRDDAQQPPKQGGVTGATLPKKKKKKKKTPSDESTQERESDSTRTKVKKRRRTTEEVAKEGADAAASGPKAKKKRRVTAETGQQDGAPAGAANAEAPGLAEKQKRRKGTAAGAESSPQTPRPGPDPMTPVAASTAPKPSGYGATWGRVSANPIADKAAHDAEVAARQQSRKEKDRSRRKEKTSAKEAKRTAPWHLEAPEEHVRHFWRLLCDGLAKRAKAQLAVKPREPLNLADHFVELGRDRHGLTQLPDVLRDFFGEDHEECLERGAVPPGGCPYVIVVAASAVRCCEIIRALRGFADGDGRRQVLKLFSKHMKVAEQAERLRAPVCIGVGTPQRLAELRAKGHLQLSHTRLVVLDMARDVKQFNIFEVQPVGAEWCQFYFDDLHPLVISGQVQMMLF